MTDRGGARSFVHDGEDGILIDPEDTQVFAAALQRLAGDATLRTNLSDAARLRVRDFSWDGVVSRYEAVYAGHKAAGGPES